MIILPVPVPRFARVLCLVGLAIAVTSCSGKVPLAEAGSRPTESPKLTRFTFFEEGNIAFIGVDVRAAEMMKAGSRELLPIGLGLANNTRGDLEFDRESFVLEVDDGSRYPLVSHSEYLERYDDSRSDVRLADTLLEAMQSRFLSYSYLPWRLYPFKGETSTATETVTLGRRSWTVGYLYFPLPEGGAKGRQFTLLVTSRDIPETLVVRFSTR